MSLFLQFSPTSSQGLFQTQALNWRPVRWWDRPSSLWPVTPWNVRTHAHEKSSMHAERSCTVQARLGIQLPLLLRLTLLLSKLGYYVPLRLTLRSWIRNHVTVDSGWYQWSVATDSLRQRSENLVHSRPPCQRQDYICSLTLQSVARTCWAFPELQVSECSSDIVSH